MITTARKTKNFYDRIADVHNLALKLNGYKDSVAKFLKSLHLDVTPETMVLDAGSGTGIVTLALHQAGFRPKKTIAFDLSRNSLKIAVEQARKEKKVDA
nr:class I SAM-dependent methyltransferase [Pyrinomonadaceae bacterium]